MREILLVRFGEVFLKGQNRPFFMKKLMDHIRQAVRPVNGRVWMSEGRFYVSDFTDMDECIRRVTRVFGVHSVSPAIEMDKDDFEAICEQAAKMMEPLSGTFKVLARRSDKRYPLDSPAIMREAGGYILEHVPHLTRGRQPSRSHDDDRDPRPRVSVRRSASPPLRACRWARTARRVCCSPAASTARWPAFMIAKRGVELCCVHYHSFPYTSERAREKVLELARLLSEYCGKMRVHVVPFTEIQMQIHAKCPENYTTLIMRRYMMRIAEIIARKDGAQALITGESIGQVASQTMEALGCTDAVVNMPVFRPAIGMDKSEIIERAQKIGTFETSSLPYEDCCTVFTPKHPATHPRIELIAEGGGRAGQRGLDRRRHRGHGSH